MKLKVFNNCGCTVFHLFYIGVATTPVVNKLVSTKEGCTKAADCIKEK